MKKETRNLISEWEKNTNALAEHFAEKYFGKDIEMWWVADDPTGVLYINDHWIDIADIINYLRYGYSKAKFFEHYQYAMDCAEKGNHPPINIKHWIKLK